MKFEVGYLSTRIKVDVEAGSVTWIAPSKYHANLVGKEAGSARESRNGKLYWIIKIDGCALSRAHIVFLFANGYACPDHVDHINGNSLDDRAVNLRSATKTQNAWNHKTRAKKADLPMGVRQAQSGRFVARIACNKKKIHLGTFDTTEQAERVYQQKRKELFGEFA